MGKEYFSHDYNTRNKKKMATLIYKEKMVGYGLFWVIVEMLHEATTNWMELDEDTYISIAKESGCKVDYVDGFIERCIQMHKVFIAEQGKFTTERVLFNVNKRSEISHERSLAGKASALAKQKATESQQNSTSVKQSSTIKLNKRKVKEKKDINTNPILSVVKEKFQLELSIQLPDNILETAERNQFMKTGKKQTQFIQSQWKLFISERMVDPDEKRHQYRKLSDLTSYFINWIRDKHPRTDVPILNHTEISSREQHDKNFLDGIFKLK